jgi:hypothetical protein
LGVPRVTRAKRPPSAQKKKEAGPPSQHRFRLTTVEASTMFWAAHSELVPIDSDQWRDARRHVTLCLIIALHGENNMTRNAKLLGLIVTAALFTAAPLSLHCSPAKVLSVSLDHAEARVGRPLTPMSVAGVNRRVHRRAYYGAAAAGAAAYGAYGYRRACGYYPYPPCY